MKPTGLSALAVLSLTVPLVAACGDSPGETRQAAAAGIHACDLFSREEAAELLDATLKESDRPAVNPVARSSECRYEAADGTRVLVLQLEELANPAARLEQFRQMWTDAETIDGLGDYAFYAASQLFVFEGDHQLVLTLGMPGRPPAERRERATEAAGTAVSRLPGGSG